MTATIITIGIDEPLPSKEEIEWRNTLQHLLVLSSGGLTLHNQPLQEIGDQQDCTTFGEQDCVLVGGALIGITKLINEITADKKLRVIQQEKYAILLEEGELITLALIATKDLKITRNKMRAFIQEFESFFETFLLEWNGDSRVYAPSKQLVAKHFGV